MRILDARGLLWQFDEDGRTGEEMRRACAAFLLHDVAEKVAPPSVEVGLPVIHMRY